MATVSETLRHDLHRNMYMAYVDKLGKFRQSVTFYRKLR